MKNAIIIPARLGSTRLKNKPLVKIDGTPMIVRVANQAIQANIADVFVACSEDEVASLLSQHNIAYIMTDPTLPSGSDRVAQAIRTLNNKYDYIMNLQGDLPDISIKSLNTLFTAATVNPTYDIYTLATKITNKNDILNPSFVKVAINHKGRALYFSRSPIPHGSDEVYHHIGIYCYTQKSLETFVNLPISNLEEVEKLEQLRALENDLKIHVSIVSESPIEINTQEDLDRIEKEGIFQSI